MDLLTVHEPLSIPERQQLLDLLDRFQQAWSKVDSKGGEVDLNDFLPPSPSPLRLHALQQMIPIDLAQRWQHGRGATLEAYLVKFPELGSAETISPELLYEEYRARQLFGDRPEPPVYKERFPAQFAQLRELVQQKPVRDVHTTDQKPTVPSPPPGPALNEDVLAAGTGYKRIKRLGSGAFGEVWRAEAPGGIEVAVKIIFRPLDHADARRELQSLELIKQLRHPFLIQTHAYWSLHDRLMIAMELADGSLRDRLRECQQANMGGIPVTELVGYFREAAEALDYLHSQNVLHRDIKPDNILLLKRHAKVADFGLARVLEKQQSVKGTSAGTPAYMAPEVWRGRVSEHSDQYSLAATYAELRLGRDLYDTRDMFELMTRHLEESPNIQTLPEAEQQVLQRALAKDPHQRFKSCQDFVRALELSLAGKLLATDPAFSRPDQGAQVSNPESGTMPQFSKLKAGDAPVVPNLDTSRMAEDSRPTPTDLVELPVPTEPGESELSFGKLWKETQPQVQKIPEPSLPPQLPTPRPPRSWSRVLLWLAPLLAVAVAAPLVYHFWPRKEADTTELFGMPANCVPAPDATERRVDGKPFYSAVDRMLDDGTPVRFVLIPRGAHNEETFYIMETKVPVSLFRKFFEAKGRLLKDDSWPLVPYNKNPENPVMGVVWLDADLFAKWLGGSLPSENQWKKAAGFFEKSPLKGPFKVPWRPKEDPASQVAVRRVRQGPAPCGFFANDVSPFGVKDMAGNGREWTRTAPPDEDLSTRAPHKDEFIVVWGQSFTEDHPLHYTDQNQVHQFDQGDPEIGFRVVLRP